MWSLPYHRPCYKPSKFVHFAWNLIGRIRLQGFCIRHFVRTILYDNKAKRNNKRETINHDGRPGAAYRHGDLCKALSDRVEPGLLRKLCFRSIIKCKEGWANNGIVTEMATFQPKVCQCRGDDAAQDNR